MMLLSPPLFCHWSIPLSTIFFLVFFFICYSATFPGKAKSDIFNRKRNPSSQRGRTLPVSSLFTFCIFLFPFYPFNSLLHIVKNMEHRSGIIIKSKSLYPGLQDPCLTGTCSSTDFCRSVNSLFLKL